MRGGEKMSMSWLPAGSSAAEVWMAGGGMTVSDGEPLSTPALCRALGAALGRRARLFPFPGALLPARISGSLEVDDSALRRALGWSPPFSLAQGLAETARWYRAAQSRSATSMRDG